MKLVSAIIRAYQLDQVREELIASDITRITVSRVAGHGAQLEEEIYRGKKVVPALIPKIKIEIAVNDQFVDTTIDAIVRAAKSNSEPKGEGEIGDGKIFVTPLERCVRIRTEESGEDAI